MKLKICFLSTLFALASLPLQITAQEKVGYEFLTAKNKNERRTKTVDLTEEAHKNCNQSLKRQIGKNYVEIKFPVGFSSEAESILDSLEKSVKKTRDILQPLQKEGVRFYLLRLNEVPLNYKMFDVLKDENFYLHLFVFKEKRELSLECLDDDKLCKSIYSTIPHELTHGAIGDLIDHKNLRWFNEGLCNYVGNLVSYDFTPSVAWTKFEENVPKVALHKTEIRANLWNWNQSANKNDINAARNQWFRYKASEQLVRLIVEESKKKGIENPLEVLFGELKKFQVTTGKAAKSEDLLSIIQQKLKVNPKELGVLPENAQKELVMDAVKTLSQNDLSNADKYYALIILSNIGEISLSIDSLNFLLREIYSNKEANSFRNLAAQALSIRIKQNEFDTAIEKFLAADNVSKRLNQKKVKKDIEELSTP